MTEAAVIKRLIMSGVDSWHCVLLISKRWQADRYIIGLNLQKSFEL